MHLEALDTLSRQTSVKLEMHLLQKVNLASSPKYKSNIEALDELFDANRLGEEEQISGDGDYELLINKKDKMFDVEHFEFLLNRYALKCNRKLTIEKIIGSFRTTSFATKEITEQIELVSWPILLYQLALLAPVTILLLLLLLLII
jgi:hypothetical protein